MVVETTATPSSPGTGAIDRDLQPGEVVGEYQVESKLGQGGFGAVFKAVHPLIGKQVAIKVLSQRFSVDPEMLSRFIAEARAVNQIRHHNIIDIFSFGSLPDGRHYYVMEYLEGEPLDRRVSRRGRLSLEDALPILRGIARALDAAHAKGIAHRDLKAENVFLASHPDGVFPKLLDFGIAKLMSPQDTRLHKTRTGAPMGTPHYMSPEQCHGRDVDHRTDMYAFGVLTYLLLTGVYPIDGEDYMTILMRQVSDDPPPPSSHRPELPAAVDSAVAWLMRKDPTARPQTLLAAVRVLEQSGGAGGRATTGEGAGEEGGAASGNSDSLSTLPLQGGNPTPGGAVVAALQRNRTPAGPPAAAALAETRVPDLAVTPGSSTKGERRRFAPHVVLAIGAVVAAAAVVAVIAVRSGGKDKGSEDSAGSAASKGPDTAGAQANGPDTVAGRGVQGADTATGRGVQGPDTAGVQAKGPDTAGQPDTAGVQAKGPDTAGVQAKGPDTAGVQAKGPDSAGQAAKGSDSALSAEVTLTIAGPPLRTEVRRAGVIVGTAPGRVRLPRSDSEVLLVLSADGYAPETLVVVPSQNRTLTVKLTPKGGVIRGVRPPPPPRGGSGSAGSAGKLPDEPTNDIDDPFRPKPTPTP